MDLRYLEYVVTLANEQNMSKAASLLHISQPTLSIYIKNLEAELGLALFVRTHNRMSLTPAGVAYVDCCRQILEMRKELYLTLESMKKPQLKVATTISSIPILMEALSHYHLEYPNITLVPSVMPAQKIDEALENRVIDFAVSTVSLNASYKKSSKIIRAFLQKV